MISSISQDKQGGQMEPFEPEDRDSAALQIPEITIELYRTALHTFDGMVCEAIAVGQAVSNRYVAPYKGWSSFIFTRLCAHGQAFMRAAPRSRWVHSDHEHWDFSAVAGHARSIMEGHLLLMYVSKEPESEDEWSARLNVIHINDCTRRIKLFKNLGLVREVDGHTEQLEMLTNRLAVNPYFQSLDQKRKSALLKGNYLTIESRDEQVVAAGMDKGVFNAWWDLLSQHTHILPLSFHRLEPNGRGTGIFNRTDLGYIYLALDMSLTPLAECVDRMVELFPDAREVRKGVHSKFSPGPKSNLPKHMKKTKKSDMDVPETPPGKKSPHFPFSQNTLFEK